MSRDPTVPVNLTTTTPVGPVERTLAAAQATDRVERLRYWRRGGSTGIDTTPTGTLLVDFTVQPVATSSVVTYGGPGSGADVINDGAFGTYTVTTTSATTAHPNLVGVTAVQDGGWKLSNTSQTSPSVAKNFNPKITFSKDIDLSTATSVVLEWGVPEYGTSRGLYLGPRPMFLNSGETKQWWQTNTSMFNSVIVKSTSMITTTPIDTPSWTDSTGLRDWAAVRKLILHMYVVYNNGGNYATLKRVWVNRKNAKAKVAFTFDDGSYTTYSQAYPVLAANGIKGGVAVIQSEAATGDDVTTMSTATIKLLHDAGWGTYNHMVTGNAQLCARMQVNNAASAGTSVVFDTWAEVVTDAVIGHTYTIRGNFGPEYNGTFTLASKPSSTQLEFTVSGPSALKTYTQTHGFCYMDWPEQTRAARIAAEVTYCKTYMEANGLTRGSDFFVAPNGAIDRSWWADLEAAGFIGARTTESHYRIDGANAVAAGMQYTKGEFPRFAICSTILDNFPLANIATLYAMIDNACDEGAFINFYGHIVGASHASGQTGLNVLTPLAEYIKTKVDAGLMDVVTLDEFARAMI